VITSHGSEDANSSHVPPPVLGGFALEGSDGHPGPTLPKRRAEAVLAVLAVCGDLGCTRERLAALLWPESEEDRARHGLRDCLHDIRAAFGHEAVPPGARLRLDGSVVDSDVQQFVRAREAGAHEEMARIYSGPLLDGFSCRRFGGIRAVAGRRARTTEPRLR
jgi:DNA-binding SARP family transcriptional activator